MWVGLTTFFCSLEKGARCSSLFCFAGPILLGLPSDIAGETLGAGESEPGDWRDLPPHPEEEQVEKDVARAFVYYPTRTLATATLATKLI